MEQRTRIYLVHGERLLRDALRMLITSWSECTLVGEAETACEAYVGLTAVSADILLVDIELPDESGFALLRRLSAEQRHTRATVLTRHFHPEYVREAMQLGASGYLSYDADPACVREALRAVHAGRTALDPRACQALVDDVVRNRITDRECQILSLIGHGACNAQIARRLGITEKTVKSHVSSLLDKLGVPGRVHLAVYARDTALLDHPLVAVRDRANES